MQLRPHFVICRWVVQHFQARKNQFCPKHDRLWTYYSWRAIIEVVMAFELVRTPIHNRISPTRYCYRLHVHTPEIKWAQLLCFVTGCESKDINIVVLALKHLYSSASITVNTYHLTQSGIFSPLPKFPNLRINIAQTEMMAVTIFYRSKNSGNESKLWPMSNAESRNQIKIDRAAIQCWTLRRILYNLSVSRRYCALIQMVDFRNSN